MRRQQNYWTIKYDFKFDPIGNCCHWLGCIICWGSCECPAYPVQQGATRHLGGQRPNAAKFAWLRREIRDWMTVEKIPFLKNTLRVSDLRFFIRSQLKINVEWQYKPNSMLKWSFIFNSFVKNSVIFWTFRETNMCAFKLRNICTGILLKGNGNKEY